MNHVRFLDFFNFSKSNFRRRDSGFAPSKNRVLVSNAVEGFDSRPTPNFAAALYKWLTALCLTVCVAACASPTPPLVWHQFLINGWFDNWAKQIDLLEYSYGDRYHMVRRKVGPEEQTLGYASGVDGPMPVGDFLYVKWRIKETGEVRDDRVELRGKLPTNMFAHSITFVIDGRQLYVYLVTPQPKSEKDPPLLKTTRSRYNVTYEIYPNNTFKP